MIPAMGIGRSLNKARLAKRIQQKKLASDVGMTPQSLNKILKERVKDPGFDTVARIAGAIGVSLDELIQDERASIAGEDNNLLRLRFEQLRRGIIADADKEERAGNPTLAKLFRHAAANMHADQLTFTRTAKISSPAGVADPVNPFPADLDLAKLAAEADSRLHLFEIAPDEFIEGDWDYPQTYRGGSAEVNGSIAAGPLDDSDGDSDEMTEVLNPTLRDVQSGRFGVTRVKGHSMEPRLHHGDLVLIDTFDKVPKPHRIMAVYRKGEGSAFGYLHKVGGTWILAKANAAEFAPVPLNGEFMIRGVVKKRLEEALE